MIKNILSSFILNLLLMFFIQTINAQSFVVKDISSNKILEYKNKKGSDTLYVFNFWATWCKPCVEELPFFSKMTDKYKKEKISFNFVSMDANKSQSIPLIQKVMIKNHLQMANIYLMNDVSPSKWIDNISKEWSGAIPGTLFLNPSKRIYQFLEKEFDEKSLDSVIYTFSK